MKDVTGNEIDKNNFELFPTARGRAEFMKFAEGKRLTRGDSLKAKCYECMGYYIDGRQDCRVKSCPLYPYMPYKE